jgi:hypothetical protein
MSQRITTSIFGASGIVGTLVILGILLKTLGVSSELGVMAMTAGIYIGIIYGLLGAVGVVKNILR